MEKASARVRRPTILVNESHLVTEKEKKKRREVQNKDQAKKKNTSSYESRVCYPLISAATNEPTAETAAQHTNRPKIPFKICATSFPKTAFLQPFQRRHNKAQPRRQIGRQRPHPIHLQPPGHRRPHIPPRRPVLDIRNQPQRQPCVEHVRQAKQQSERVP